MSDQTKPNLEEPVQSKYAGSLPETAPDTDKDDVFLDEKVRQLSTPLDESKLVQPSSPKSESANATPRWVLEAFGASVIAVAGIFIGVMLPYNMSRLDTKADELTKALEETKKVVEEVKSLSSSVSSIAIDHEMLFCQNLMQRSPALMGEMELRLTLGHIENQISVLRKIPQGNSEAIASLKTLLEGVHAYFLAFAEERKPLSAAQKYKRNDELCGQIKRTTETDFASLGSWESEAKSYLLFALGSRLLTAIHTNGFGYGLSPEVRKSINEKATDSFKESVSLNPTFDRSISNLSTCYANQFEQLCNELLHGQSSFDDHWNAPLDKTQTLTIKEKIGPSGNFVGLLEFSAKENLYARQRTLPAYSWVELTVVGAGCGTGC